MKEIHEVLKRIENLWYIADIKGFGNCLICWSIWTLTLKYPAVESSVERSGKPLQLTA